MIVTPRPHFDWRLRTRSLPLGQRTLLAGVVNVTPDSFSDGGQFLSSEQAVAHALQLLHDGADILDIGGESTRPGARPQVSSQQELDRVLPVIEAILRERPHAILSIDTYKSPTARAAIAAGAEIINDVSGFLWDERMASTSAQLRCGVVLTHTRGRMAEWHTLPPLAHEKVVPLVLHGLQKCLTIAHDAGVDQASIMLDPGFGFGKRFEENYPLLAHLDQLHILGCPILAGTSRKAFLARTLATMYGHDVPPNQRGNATLASITAAALAGAHILRVHDVKSAREALAIADAIRG
jgi:dihydropteroate synthase